MEIERDDSHTISIEYIADPDSGVVSVLVDRVQVDCAPAGSDELARIAKAIGSTVSRINGYDNENPPLCP